MINYTKEEIQSSTTIARNFGSILDNLKNRKLEKVAVMRNNIMVAVIIPIEEYEYYQSKNDLEEHVELYSIIKKREKEDIEKGISFESVLDEYGIKLNEI